jgi:hypothetical protein
MGTQLAEGGARLQTIMAVLGHKSTAMAMIYTRISDPEVRRQYEAALTAGQRIAGPAAEATGAGRSSQQAATAPPAELGTVQPVIRLDGPRLST